MAELLAPAGSLDHVLSAIDAGADAVYLGGKSFNARKFAHNLSDEELAEAVRIAHVFGVRIYVTVNIVMADKELKALTGYLKYLDSIGVDGIIVQDLAVAAIARKVVPNLPLHGSTQMTVADLDGVRFLERLGFTQAVLAREVSLDEIREICSHTTMAIEVFIHGASCMSYSGQCLMSSFIGGRSGNRGACAQPCRWSYALMEQTRKGEYFPIDEDETGTYILNSKDMCMLEHIPELVEAGVDSFKIEGRAKSAYYTAIVTNAYRAAIDGYLKNPSPDYKPEKWICEEPYKVSFRDYCTGFYFDDPKTEANISLAGGYRRIWDVMGVVQESDGKFLTVAQRNKFCVGDTLELLEKGKCPKTFTVSEMFLPDGTPIDAAPHPMMILKIPCALSVPAGSLLRKQAKNG